MGDRSVSTMAADWVDSKVGWWVGSMDGVTAVQMVVQLAACLVYHSVFQMVAMSVAMLVVLKVDCSAGMRGENWVAMWVDYLAAMSVGVLAA